MQHVVVEHIEAVLAEARHKGDGQRRGLDARPNVFDLGDEVLTGRGLDVGDKGRQFGGFVEFPQALRAAVFAFLVAVLGGFAGAVAVDAIDAVRAGHNRVRRRSVTTRSPESISAAARSMAEIQRLLPAALALAWATVAANWAWLKRMVCPFVMFN